ncbi:MAG: nuclear transport factor 2 family protein [Hyphomonadaceae bacterium]|nr:nuclear transport factor 2 family protein [Hyphomonadaceae bacterium]
MTDPAQQAARPPVPPFDETTAAQKARMAEDAWNSRDPQRVALAYTPDCHWRNRTDFIYGRAEIEAFLARKWAKELDYRLIKEVWGFRNNRMAVRFACEWHDTGGQWFRSYGVELWEFDAAGLMRRRVASINDAPIGEAERLYRWAPGPRPADHPGLSELGL